MSQATKCAVIVSLLATFSLVTVWAQEPVSPPVELPEERPILPKKAQPLPPGTAVEGSLYAARPQTWYVLDLSDPGDAQSLLLELQMTAGARGDVDLELYDAGANAIASSVSTTDRERCLVPIGDRQRAYVRVYLYGEPDELRGDRAEAEYTLRAELSPRETLPGIGAFVDDIPPLRDGQPVSDRLPARGSENPGRRMYLIDLSDTDATVARVVMKIANPDEVDIDLDVYDEMGQELASSVETGPREMCFVPIEDNKRLFAAAYLADSDDRVTGRYELSLGLSSEEPGPAVIERVEGLGVKSFVVGQRALGQVTEGRKDFLAWLYQPEEPVSAVVLNPAEAGASPRLILRNSEGWIIGESTEADGLQQVALEAIEDSYLLVQVTAEKPCGFSLCATPVTPAITFDPANAKPLAVGSSATGRVGGEAGSVAVYRLEAPLSAAVPQVTLKADPIFADLDLFVCATPEAVLSIAAEPGGLETAAVPLGGVAPVYVVVMAAEGVAAEFEVAVE